MSSCPSSNQLLQIFEGSKHRSRDLIPIPDVIFDPEYWIKHRWVLLIDKEATSQALENRKNFTMLVMEKAHRFLQWINHPSGEEERLSTRLLNILGKGRPTLAKAILVKDHEENGAVLLFDGKDLRKYLPEVSADVLFEEVDGTVTVESALLPQALKERFPSVSSIETTIVHRDIFKDEMVREQVFDFLSN